MAACDCRGATDVTGYGLLGHAYEISQASDVTLQIESSQVPLLPNTLELASQGFIPGGSKANRTWLEAKKAISWGDVDETLKTVLNDAQTSGGLLICIPEPKLNTLLNALSSYPYKPAVIGKVIPPDKHPLYVF